MSLCKHNTHTHTQTTHARTHTHLLMHIKPPTSAYKQKSPTNADQHICVLILLYTCPHTAVYVSFYCYIRVLILLHMCVLVMLRSSHGSIRYMCVLVLLSVLVYVCVAVYVCLGVLSVLVLLYVYVLVLLRCSPAGLCEEGSHRLAGFPPPLRH